MKKLKLILLVTVHCLLFTVLIGCGKKAAEVKVAKIPVKIMEVKLQNIKKTLGYVGNIKAEDEAIVYPKVAGKIIEKVKEKGDKVKEGDILVYIDRDEVGFKFQKSPVETPIDGIVGRIYIDKGTNVSSQTPIALVVNMDTVKALVNISEKYLGRLKKGVEANVKVDAYPDEVFVGKVVSIAPIVDLATRTSEVEIRISNKEHQLKPGMFARVNIILEKKENALIVPIKAVLNENSHKFVFVVNGSIARKREVKTGIYQKDFVEIIEGLNVDEDIIIEGNYGLKDGANILIETSGDIQ